MAKHEHFAAFTLDPNGLKAHLIFDHGVKEKDLPKESDMIRWHNTRHPEIKPPPQQ